MKKNVLLWLFIAGMMGVFAQSKKLKEEGDIFYNKGNIPEAANSYYKCMEKGKDSECALKLFELMFYYPDKADIGISYPEQLHVLIYPLADKEGNSLAQYYLGQMYSNGYCVNKNETEATKWFKMSADQGNVEAQYYMGLRCENGIGIEKNMSQAVGWYEKAAEKDNLLALWKLGGFYFDGVGVKKNWQTSYFYCDITIRNYNNASQSEKDRLNLAGFNLVKLQAMISEMDAARKKEEDEKKKATYIEIKPNKYYVDGNKEDKIRVIVSSDGRLGKLQATTTEAWCNVVPHVGYFEVKYFRNTGATRSAIIVVSQDDISTTVEIVQSNATSRLSVSPKTTKISSTGGSSEVKIITDGSWSYSDAPSWITISRSDDKLKVAAKNKTTQQRSSYLLVTSGKFTEKIQVIQKGPFNSPKSKYMATISVGYIHKTWFFSPSTNAIGVIDDIINPAIGGWQFGYRINPLFKYGLGLSTGVFLNYFKPFSSSGNFSVSIPENDNKNSCRLSPVRVLALSIPVHLEYRYHISRKFQIFIEGGPGIDLNPFKTFDASLSVNGKTPSESYGFSIKPFNITMDFGGGIQFGSFQLNITSGFGLINVSKDPSIIIKQNNKFSIALTYKVPRDY